MNKRNSDPEEVAVSYFLLTEKQLTYYTHYNVA